MVKGDVIPFLQMKSSEINFLRNAKTLEHCSKDSLLHMRDTERLLHESDKSTARFKTLENVRTGDFSFQELLYNPSLYEFLPLIKVNDFVGSVLNISSIDATLMLENRRIKASERELGTLSLNEKNKIQNMIEEVLHD